MKRLILATMLLGIWNVPTYGDEIVRWPDGRRVYVVDSHNLGVGRIQKPKGIDVIVLRHKGKWGVVPSSLYDSPASVGRYRIGK